MSEKWTLAADGDGLPCLFRGDTAVLRPHDLPPSGYRDVLWEVLVAVLVRPDEAVEAVAVALYHQRVRHTADLTGARRLPWLELTAAARDRYRAEARAALDALAPAPPLDPQAAHVAAMPRAMDLIHDAVVAEPDGDVGREAQSEPVDVTHGRWRITASYAREDNVTIYRDGEHYRTTTFPAYKIWNIPAHLDEYVEQLEQEATR